MISSKCFEIVQISPAVKINLHFIMKRAVERLRVAEPVELLVERREVVAGRADVRVLRAERLLEDRQGAEVQRVS